MKIRELNIRNFRGIKTADVNFPAEGCIVCLIGPGDSTKSTILRAIEWLLFPSWNLSVNDNDFHNRNIDEDIVISGCFTEVPEPLTTDEKFSLYLRNPDVPLELDREGAKNDEPVGGENDSLAVRLTINSDLEPRWEVVCNHQPTGKSISSADRKMFFVENPGANFSKDLSWGRLSVLPNLGDGDTRESLRSTNMQIMRMAVDGVNLDDLDEITNAELDKIGKEYGVPLNPQKLRNRIQLQNSASSGAVVSLFEGDTPLTQKGTGSQRLLSLGLNIAAANSSGILLIDEVENGLEPYRLRTLIDNLRTVHESSGQIIMTTHSTVVLQECFISELMVVRSREGKTEAVSPRGDDEEVDSQIQGAFRATPEAFLSKKVIVCEGATEIGFMRALNKYLSRREDGFRLAYKGVETVDGHGDNVFKYADSINRCGYKMCLFMDSDKPNSKKSKKTEDVKSGKENYKEDKQAFLDKGVSVFDWEEGNAIENQVFSDVPAGVVERLLQLAFDIKKLSYDENEISAEDVPYVIEDDKVRLTRTDRQSMEFLGRSAKKKSWFKRIDYGEMFGDVIFDNWQEIKSSSDSELRLVSTVEKLIEWVMVDD